MPRLGIAAGFSFVAIVLGCGGVGGFVYERVLVEDIELHATDTMEQMELIEVTDGGKRQLVPPTVYAVGWDESYLIAKRHPPSATGQSNDKTRTEYFIVAVQSGKVHGPFDLMEYTSHRDQMGVAGRLDFTLTFHELE
jgi:hypothetical protein